MREIGVAMNITELGANEAKELVVGQLYAYCGFPRALNAAGTLMKVAGEVKNFATYK